MINRSIRYIDELQKFLEDDHFKISLKLEPNSPTASSSSSKESVRTDPTLMAELNLSPAKGIIRTHHSHAPTKSKSTFVPGHRKSRSDGGNIFLACSGRTEIVGISGTGPGGHGINGVCDSKTKCAVDPWGSEEKLRNLLDDSLLEDPLSPPQSLIHPTDSDHLIHSEKIRLTEKNISGEEEEITVEPGTKCTFQVNIVFSHILLKSHFPKIYFFHFVFNK